jgi:hypothetical protein
MGRVLDHELVQARVDPFDVGLMLFQESHFLAHRFFDQSWNLSPETGLACLRVT